MRRGNMTTNRIRQSADTKQHCMERYRTYTDVIARYNKAIKAEFYLEAITLMESIIADRLESYLIRKTGNKALAFKTLEKLIRGLKNNNDVLMPISDIEDWKNSRNMFLHEMAKIEDGKYEDFQTKYYDAKQCAEDGMKLFRMVDAICK